MSAEPRSIPEKLPPGHRREDLDAAVARAHAAGYGRNRIAEALGVGTGTVSRAAVRLGIEFDGTATAQATTARVEHARHALAVTLSEVAEVGARRMLAELRAEVIDPATLRAVSTATGIAVDKIAVIAEQLPAPADDMERAHAFIENLSYGVRAAYDQQQVEESGQPP